MDELLDALVLLDAVRDEGGAIVDFVYADANAAACACHGVTRDQLVGARLLDRAPADQAPGLLDAYRRVVETGQPLQRDDVDFGQGLPGGEARCYDVRAVRVGDGLSYMWRDVTQRHEVAAELAASREGFRLLAENASDVVVRADNDGDIEWISPSVTALVGWLPEQLVGEPFANLVHADDLPGLRAAAAMLLGGEPARPEVRVRTADGGYRWISISVRPLFDDAGVVVGRIAGWRDAQAEVEARRELQASEERFRLLAENSSDVVFTAGPDRRMTWVAPTVARTLGWTPEELAGTEMADLVHPDDWAAVDGLRLRAHGGHDGQALGGALLARMRTRTGEYRWMSGTCTPLVGEDGQAPGVVVGLKDVDDLVRAREAVQLDQARLRATLDSLLDPHILAQAVRADDGRITDFVCADANEAAGGYLNTDRSRLLGARLLDLLPAQAAPPMLALWTHTVETGQPLLLDDYAFPAENHESERLYDFRMVRVGDGLSCTWRDVTERHRTQRALQRRVEELDALRRILQLLAERGDLADALESAGAEICQLFDAGYARVHLLPEGEDASTAASFETFGAAGAPAPEEAAVIRETLASGRRAVSESLGYGTRHLLGVPMMSRSQVIGVLTVAREHPAGAFDVREMSVVQPVADALAAAVESERLQQRETRQAATDERQRLARDLHDSVTQSIYSANLIAEVLPAAWERSPAEGRHDLEMLRRLVRAAMAEMRTLLFELRPEALPAASLDGLLERLGDALAGQGEIAVDIAVQEDLELPVPVKLAFYRVAQEALNNVGRHARATRVKLDVADDAGAARLSVRDDGRGFACGDVRPESMGLRIMKERAAEIGATIEIDGTSGNGTTVKMAWRRPVPAVAAR